MLARGNQSVSHCPIANQSEDAIEIARHMWLFCDECRTKRITKLLQRKPLNGLRDAPPSNSNLTTERSDAENDKRPKRERERKQDAGKSTYIPDGLQINRLMKAGITKREAVQKFVDEKRQEALAKKAKEMEAQANEKKAEEAANKKVDPSNLPWTPRYDKFLLHSVSKLNRVVDHQRYIAIISNFLDTHKTLRYDHNRQEIKAIDEQLADERKAFQEHVKKIYHSTKQQLYLCGNFEANRFVLNRLMKRRGAHLHDHYGSPMRVIASASDEEDVVLRLKYNLLSGCMPKIVIPNERRKFAFSNDSELVKEHFTEDKCDQSPLESDELAEHLALKYGVNIISGVSSILSIVCREWLCDSANYVIPICVKHVFDKNTGRTRRLCVVGKRCVVDTINYPSLWSRFLRYSVRIALHQTQKTSALKTGGRQRAVMSKIGKTERTSSDVQKEGDGADESVTIQDSSSTREGENDSSAEAGLSGRNEADTNNAASENNGELVEDVLAGIMKEMGSTTSSMSASNEIDGAMEQGLLGLSEYKGVDWSKRYSVFEFSGKGHEQDLNILIRSGNDGIDVQSGTSVALAVKPEFLVDYGAERLNDEEWLHDVMRCTFKGASHLIRLRLHHSELHFLQKERYELRTLVLREERRRTLYSKRIQFLKSVLNELENLQAGNYVLRMNKENAIEILPQQQEDTTLDTVKKIEIDVKKQDEIKVSRAVGFPFEGIDEHVALVYHLMQKRIPAAFLPERQNKWRGAEVPKTSQNQQSTSNSNNSKNKKRSRKRGDRKRKRNNNNNNSNTNNNSNSDNNKQQPAAKRKRIDLDAPQ